MKLTKWLLAICCLLMQQKYLSAQDKLNIKFGKIAPADFDLSKEKIDSSADAVVIADIGKTTFEGNRRGKGEFSLVYTRYRRAKILNKDGFDIADLSFVVYNDGEDQEELEDVKAVTYNLENGKVIETKLDAKSIFSEKVGHYSTRKKFTLPGVKAGSIIEVSYKIRSDFYHHLRAWNFQGVYPVLWSEYEVHIPSCFQYVMLNQGDQEFFVKTSKTETADYSIRQSNGVQSDDIYRISSQDLVGRWVKKDVPAMKDESFTTTIANYISRVEFQLHYTQFTASSPRTYYLQDWYKASEKLLASESFGIALDRDNNWMGSEMKTIYNTEDNSDVRAEKIYDYVRDHFTCTDHDQLYATRTLKSVFQAKNGSVAEINLLLTAMFRHAGIEADPMILSTRDNGMASENYPLIDRFNYVICATKINNKSEFLDASWPMLPYNHLPIDCYNGMARTINKDLPYVAYFSSDSLTETKSTSVIIINDEKGKPSGAFSSLLGQFESYDLRKKVKKEGQKEYFKNIQTSYGTDLTIANTVIDSFLILSNPIKVSYDFDIKSVGQEDIIYFNPMLSEGYKENPFKSAERKYPVEMPYTFDEIYTLNMEVPQGYVVDELPKSARVNYNNNQGSFEYLIQLTESGIQMRSRLKMNRAFFGPDEYNSLREFFGHVVKKQSEQIVFKKKK